MKIKKLAIENFKGVEKMVLYPGTLTALVAPNGSGKTSVMEAIKTAITGEWPENPIRNFTEEASVRAEFEDAFGGDYAIGRYKNTDSSKNRVTLNHKKATQKSVNEYVVNGFANPVSIDTLKVCTASEVLSSMEPEDFMNLIFQYQDQKFTVPQIIDMCGPMDAKTQAEIENMLPAEVRICDIDNALEEATEGRKLQGREVKALEARSAFNGIVPSRTEAQVESDLEAIAKAEGAVEAQKAAYVQYVQALENRKKQLEGIAKLDQQIASITAYRPRQEDLAKMESDKQYYTGELANLQKLIGTLENDKIMFQRSLKNLESPVCPLSDKLVCQTDKTKIREELEEVLRDTEESIDAQIKRCEDVRRRIVNVENDIAIYKGNEAAYQQKIMLMQQRDQQQRILPKEPTPVAQPQATADYSQQKQALMMERQMIMAYRQAMQEGEKLKKAKEQYEILDAIVGFFNKNGKLRETMVSSFFGILEQEMNQTAAMIRPDFEIKLVYKKGLEVYCRPRPTADFNLWTSASSGERALIMFLVLDLLNELTGTRVLILDDLERLDKDAFEALVQTITNPNIIDRYDHVFLAIAEHEETLQAVQKAGFDIITKVNP